jgi:hypothetical protein
MAVEALYAYGTSPRTYFVEATREYKRDGECSAVMYARGTVVRESGKFSTENLRLNFALCDRATVSYMLPLGVLKLQGGVYWIAQMSSWDRENYTIIDITPHSRTKDQVTPGGGC